jgi:hypothetical protein
MIMYHYRVTKYDSSLRDEWDSYTRAEWTGRRHIGTVIGGHTLTEDEYIETENKYLYAFESFAYESGVRLLTVRGLDKGPGTPAEWQDLRNGATLSVDRAVDLVRLMLREGPVAARMEVEDRFFVHIGTDMYMWIGSHVDCVKAIADAERIGLFVDRDVVSPLLPEPGESRYWWLREGEPVVYELVSYDRATGRTLGRWDLPDECIPLLRPLFDVDPEDVQFYDSYEVEERARPKVAEILRTRLDPDKDYFLQTHTRR